MELETVLRFQIDNAQCQFRTLNKKDVNTDYVNSLAGEKRFLINVLETVSDQEKYVERIAESPTDCLFGLFMDNKLLGTAGVQNVKANVGAIKSFSQNNTTLGVLVLDDNDRRKGLGKALVWAATKLLNKTYQVEYVVACMERDNTPSLRTFLSCGFKQISNKGQSETGYRLVLNISDLKKPEIIKHVTMETTSDSVVD